jgi:hypothetical protein
LLFAACGNTYALMKTMTVKLPEELAVRLEKRAKRLGVSKSAVLRKSLERDLAEHQGAVEEAPSMYDLTRDDCGCVDSGVTDLATNPKYMEGCGQ